MKKLNSTINVTELDFDFIKQDIIDYLKSQEEFSDYNFEGSALNVLIDTLAVNTFKNAYMANMLANEMFLDSASIRESVVSKAKEIGYVPRSCRASKALVTIEIKNVAGSPSYISMEAGTSFDTPSGNKFTTEREHLLYPRSSDPTTYYIENVTIYDGNYVEYHYTVDYNDPDQKFLVMSDVADISTLRVFVQENKNSTNIEEYFLNDDLNRLKPDSKIYFVNEHASGNYEITFGDGILGKKLLNGNYITLSYVVSSGREKANFENTFIPIEDISGYGDINIITQEASYGGAEKENIENIKFLAPRMYQSQKRAVTVEDYETFLLHEYPWIESINSWGGEYNDPPVYGKVFFAIKPKNTSFVTTRMKKEIINDLIKKYNVVTIIPEIIDPDYIYVNIDTSVYYRKSKTIKDDSQLVTETINTIIKYFNDTTQKFKMDFKFSPMVSRIDNTDDSFDSSLTDIKFHKRIYPKINMSQTFEIQFNNEINKNSIISTIFNVPDKTQSEVYHKTYFMDDGNGIINLIRASDNSIFIRDIGIVDYNKGYISVTIFPYQIPSDTLDIRIYATPTQKNIKSGYNQIIVYDESPINIDVMRLQGIQVKMINIEE